MLKLQYRGPRLAFRAGGLGGSARARGFDERLDALRTLTLEVVLCLIAGDDVRQTAEYLRVSPASVRYHIDLAKQALDCASIDELRRSCAEAEQRRAA